VGHLSTLVATSPILFTSLSPGISAHTSAHLDYFRKWPSGVRTHPTVDTPATCQTQTTSLVVLRGDEGSVGFANDLETGMPDLHPLTWLATLIVALILATASVTAFCSGWTTRGNRCRNIAGGPFHRCRHHGGEIVLHDFIGLFLVTGVILLGWKWATHDGVSALLTDITK
jgi:hypothetical protein